MEIFLFILVAGLLANFIGASVHEGIFVGALVSLRCSACTSASTYCTQFATQITLLLTPTSAGWCAFGVAQPHICQGSTNSTALHLHGPLSTILYLDYLIHATCSAVSEQCRQSKQQYLSCCCSGFNVVHLNSGQVFRRQPL